MPSNGAKTGERDAKGRFQPGNTGGGRKAMPDDLREAFRAACPAALAVLARIVKDKDARNSDRIKAAEIILDRGYGKPVQAVDLSSEAADGAVGVVIMPAVLDDGG